jgi:hypothetical protein
LGFVKGFDSTFLSFHAAQTRPERSLYNLALAGLYLAGIVYWVFFLNFGVTLLSIGKIYLAIFSLLLPLVDSERVSARFFVVPLVFLAVLAAIHFQRFLDAHKPFSLRQILFSLGVTLVLAHDFMQHSRLWRVTNLYDLFPRISADSPLPCLWGRGWG